MDFLMQEYSQMYEEKRHYDNRSNSFITMYFALLTICVAVISLANAPTGNDLKHLLFVMSAVQILAGVVVIIALYFNRVSSVKAYRQINSIRDFCVNGNESLNTWQNKMKYTSSEPNYFKYDSMHFAVTILIMGINSVIVGSIVFYAFNHILLGVLCAALSKTLQLVPYIYLLKNRDRQKSSSLPHA